LAQTFRHAAFAQLQLEAFWATSPHLLRQFGSAMPALNPAFADILELLTAVPDGSETAVAAVRARDAELVKPAGSLGRFEEIVEFLARWQHRPMPRLDNPMLTIFAGNHGVAAQGVSAYSQDVTAQMVASFTNGGAAISQICGLHEINLRVFELALELPTGDITVEPALDDKMCAATIAYGMEAVAGKPDIIGLGEMGIGNTTIASAIFAALYGGTGADWAGRGTGLDEAGIARKAAVIDAALALHAAELDHPLAILARLGGREIAAMLGALIAARHQKVPVVIDGFVATAAAAIAHSVNPEAIDHCLFAHVSGEEAHARVLAHIGVKPLLDLGMRLGEGTGAAMGIVLAKTALHVHANMATFESGNVSRKL
jgi:nicotinate-nucleotide--dimethylbenzimidazole phosphoribosyltransferase